MKRNLISAAVLVLTSMAANAACFDFGTVVGTQSNSSATFFSGSVTSCYTFTLTGTGSVSGTLFLGPTDGTPVIFTPPTNFALTHYFGSTLGSHINLSGPTTIDFDTSVDPNVSFASNYPYYAFSATGLGAGNYTLSYQTQAVVGHPTLGSALSSVQVSAVPEPETYAMMLAGLGAIGLIAKRRKQA